MTWTNELLDEVLDGLEQFIPQMHDIQTVMKSGHISTEPFCYSLHLYDLVVLKFGTLG